MAKLDLKQDDKKSGAITGKKLPKDDGGKPKKKKPKV